MSTESQNIDWAAVRARAGFATEDEFRVYVDSIMTLGQDLYLDAVEKALAADPARAEALTFEALAAALGRALAEVERVAVVAEVHDHELIDVDQRLSAMVKVIRDNYYPRWRRLVQEQDPRHRQ